MKHTFNVIRSNTEIATNSATDCSSEFKFGTEFQHFTGDMLQMFEIKGQRLRSQRKVMYQQQKRYNTAMDIVQRHGICSCHVFQFKVYLHVIANENVNDSIYRAALNAGRSSQEKAVSQSVRPSVCQTRAWSQNGR